MFLMYEYKNSGGGYTSPGIDMAFYACMFKKLPIQHREGEQLEQPLCACDQSERMCDG